MPVTAVDIALAVLVILSALFAMTRGFTREFLSLVSWVAAATLTFFGYFMFRDQARSTIDIPYVSDAILVLGMFFVSLLIISFITARLSDMILNSQVGPLDRAMGFAFGVARALLIGAVGIFLFDAALQNPKAHPPMVSESKSVPVLRTVRDKIAYSIIGIFPEDFERDAIKRYRETFVGFSGSTNEGATASLPPASNPDLNNQNPSRSIEDLIENSPQ